MSRELEWFLILLNLFVLLLAVGAYAVIHY